MEEKEEEEIEEKEEEENENNEEATNIKSNNPFLADRKYIIILFIFKKQPKYIIYLEKYFIL